MEPTPAAPVTTPADGTAHRFFVCFDRGADPVAWDPYDPTDLPRADCAYLGAVVRSVLEGWEGRPLTFYVTQDPRWLPTVGDDVVAFLLNDAWFRRPSYLGAVLAVARQSSGTPWFPVHTLWPLRPLSLAALGNHLRILATRARFHRDAEADATAAGWPSPRTGALVDIPLGYHKQPELPLVPFAERGTDVYFGGSVVHDTSRGARWKRVGKKYLGNPKSLYRNAMVAALERWSAAHPERIVRLTLTGDFHSVDQAAASSYGDHMMDCRVALAPRGTSLESYRVFEGWRYGCVVVADAAGPQPFYSGAPLVLVRSWDDLDDVLDGLFADPGRMQRLSDASLAWWRDVCSGEAVGRVLGRRLRELTAA
ncbi:hypothetical protein [Aquipuribacter hungaricus]|uniref:Glycosyltransferase family 1 protein n=1 Tax=Aquipuribacter hungaricus TaxID=545624 RepID=A0ABV7WAQ4_9MICO